MSWTDKGADVWFLVLDRGFGSGDVGADEHTNVRTFVKRWQHGDRPQAGKPFHVSSLRWMFGDHSLQIPPENLVETHWKANGFTSLAWFAMKSHGGCGHTYLSECDAVWPYLMWWKDTAHNGRSEDGEWLTMKQMGVKQLGLLYSESDRSDDHGNHERYVGNVVMESGTQLNPSIGDWWFLFKGQP